MLKPEFILSREKHLDHMVKVVPFIVGCYFIQCYIILQIAPSPFTVNSLIFLGLSLGAMISCFIAYDLKHGVEFYQDGLSIRSPWPGKAKFINYQDISQVLISEKDQAFATIKIVTQVGKKYHFYFVDDADKMKKWLNQKLSIPMSQAA